MPDYNTIRSELSYAYLHAIVAHMGCSYSRAATVDDFYGYDANCTFRGNWSDLVGAQKQVSIKFQLKSTSTNYTETNNKIGYSIPTNLYEKYRQNCNMRDYCILLLMILPDESQYEQWVELSEEELSLKKCMYWTTLHNAPQSENTSDQTLYFPKNNLFTTQSLKEVILKNFAEGRYIDYEF